MPLVYTLQMHLHAIHPLLNSQATKVPPTYIPKVFVSRLEDFKTTSLNPALHCDFGYRPQIDVADMMNICVRAARL